MKFDKTTLVVCALCIVAITATLFARNFIYTVAPLPVPTSDKLGSDPYAGGRITIHYHKRPPYSVSHGKSVGGIIGDRINFVFNQARIPLAWQKTPAGRQLEVIKNYGIDEPDDGSTLK